MTFDYEVLALLIIPIAISLGVYLAGVMLKKIALYALPIFFASVLIEQDIIEVPLGDNFNNSVLRELRVEKRIKKIFENWID